MIWSTNLTFGPGITDEDLNGSGIAVDASNNICLAVTSTQPNTPGSADIVAVKFSLEGTHLWMRRYGNANCPEHVNDFTVDMAGNVIVVGGLWNSLSPPQSASDKSCLDMLVLKYSPDGQLLWTANYAEFPGCRDDAIRVATDFENNIYMTGVSETTNASTPQSVVLKYSPEGLLLWRMRHADSLLWLLAANTAGDVFTVGHKHFLAQFNITELLAMKLGQVEPRVAVCTGLEEGTFYGVLVSPRGSAYEVLSSTNLQHWTPFTTVVNETGLVPFYDPGAGSEPARFYRARALSR